MSSERKVLLLSIVLILFIVGCVYKHLPQFMQEENAEKNVVIEEPKSINNEKTQKTEEESTTKTEETQEKVTQTPIKETPVQEKKSEEITSVETQIQSTPVDSNVGENVTTAQEQVAQVEENREPLITTDIRYQREGDERNIQDLSFEIQELQLKMNDFLKENPIIFKRKSYEITQSSEVAIEEVAKALNEYPNIKIEVAGHTDAAGAAEYNQEISRQRAESVKAMIVKLGIDENRIIARGYGEDIPLVPNSPNGYSKINRRVEFNIIGE